MEAPLYDITIYYSGPLQEEPYNKGFRLLLNFVSESYYLKLNGYKPPKTGRICLHLSVGEQKTRPSYFGSLCTCYGTIDEQQYLKLEAPIDQYRFILEILHRSLLEPINSFSWDKAVFDQAYQEVIASNFKLEKRYPPKKSKNRKYTAQAIVQKTKEVSILAVNIIEEGNSSKIIKLTEKENHSFYDNIYPTAKAMKWIDNTRFGIIQNQHFLYYDVASDQVLNNAKLRETTLYS